MVKTFVFDPNGPSIDMVNHDGWQTTVVGCGVVVVDVEAKLLLFADEEPGDFVELCPLALCFDVDERLLVCSLES